MELNIIIATSNYSYSVTQTVIVEEPKEVQLLLKSSLAASFFQCKAFGPFNNSTSILPLFVCFLVLHPYFLFNFFVIVFFILVFVLFSV